MFYRKFLFLSFVSGLVILGSTNAKAQPPNVEDEILAEQSLFKAVIKTTDEESFTDYLNSPLSMRKRFLSGLRALRQRDLVIVEAGAICFDHEGHEKSDCKVGVMSLSHFGNIYGKK